MKIDFSQNNESKWATSNFSCVCEQFIRMTIKFTCAFKRLTCELANETFSNYKSFPAKISKTNQKVKNQHVVKRRRKNKQHRIQTQTW